MLEGVLCGAVRSQASSEGSAHPHSPRLQSSSEAAARREGRDSSPRRATRLDSALGLVATADAGCLSDRFCSVLSARAWARSDSAACRPQRRCCAGGGRGHAGLDQRLSLSCSESTDLADVLGFNFTDVLAPAEGLRHGHITQFVHGIRILLFARVGVYCRFVNGTASATRAPCGQSP